MFSVVRDRHMGAYASYVQRVKGLFLNPTGARAYYSAYFGQGTGVIHLGYVWCIGMEYRLLSCYHNLAFLYFCTHTEDVGVKCHGMSVLCKKKH